MKFVYLLVFVLTLSACGSLHDSVRKGDLKAVRAGLNSGTSVNAIEGKYEKSLLAVAIEENRVSIAKELLSRGANTDKVDFCKTALMIAAQYGRIDLMRSLLDKGVDVNQRGCLDDTALHSAASWDKPDAVRILIGNGADFFAQNYKGRTAFHEAAETRNYSESALIALIELAHEKDKKMGNLPGEPPLLYRLVNFNNEDNHTPLHRAAINGNTKKMQILLNAGANPNAVTSSGETAQTLYARVMKKRGGGGGFDFGKALAIAGGAALAGSSNLSSAQKADFMVNYTADVVNDTGGTNTRNWGNQQSQRMSALGQGKALPSNSSSLKMTCNSKQTNMCGEYTFPSATDRDNFVSQCKSGGGSILSGNCPPGPSCYHNDNGRSVTTYVYRVSAADVKDKCEREGGTFKN